MPCVSTAGRLPHPLVLVRRRQFRSSEMAYAARSLGHEYIVLTDHSPRLTIANGLSTERLMRQLEEIEQVNARLAAEAESGAPPFRVLSGIEVDITRTGRSTRPRRCSRALDIVVGSVHSKLRSPGDVMTKRMLDRDRGPEPRHPGTLHRPDRRRPRSSAVGVRSRRRLRRVPGQRRRRRDQLPPRAQGPAARPAEASRRPWLPLLDRHRRPRPGSARVAVHRL